MSNIGRISGVFNTPASGNTVITVDDAFAVHFWYARVTADDTVQAHQQFGHGFAAGSDRDSGMTAGEDGQNQNQRDGRNANWCLITDAPGTSDVILGNAVTFNASNVTLSYTTVEIGYRIHYEIWYGTDGSAEMREVTASSSPVSDLTMSTPDMVLGWTLGQLHPASSIHAYQAFGVAVDNGGIEQWCQFTYMGDSDTDSVGSSLIDGEFLGQVDVDFTAWSMQITALGSNGCAWNGTNADEIILLFLDLAGDAVDVGTFAKSTSAAPVTQQMPDFGFIPDGYALATCNFDLQTRNTDRIVVNSFGAYSEEVGAGHSALAVGTPQSNSDRASWSSPTEVLAGSVALQASGVEWSATPDAITDQTPSFELNPNTTGGSDDVIIGYYGHEEQAGGTEFTQTVLGSMTPTGAVLKETAKAVDGAAAPAGALTKLSSVTLLGALTPVGALIRDTLKLLAGSVTPTGIAAGVRLFFQTLAGSLTPVGTMVRETTKQFAGALTPVGIMTFMPQKGLAGAVTPSGVIVRDTSMSFAGALTPSGLLTRQTDLVAFTGSVTPTGTTVLTVLKALAGSLIPTGVMTRLTSIFPAGALTPVGTQVRRTFTAMAGALTPTGALGTSIIKLITLLGSMTPTGLLSHSTLKNVAGSLIPTGAIIRTTLKSVTGTLIPVGVIIIRDTFKLLVGVVTPTGALATSVVKIITLLGSVTPTGAVAFSTLKRVAGSLTPSGAITRLTSFSVAGALAPVGTLIRDTFKLLAGAVAPSGVITTIVVKIISLVGGIVPTGALTRSTLTSMAGAISPSGVITRLTSLPISGVLTPAGTLIRDIRKVVAGVLVPVGTLIKTVIFTLAMGGVVTPVGSMVRFISKFIAGATTPTGATTKETSIDMSGAVTPVGDMTPMAVFIQAVSGAVTAIGDLATMFISGVAEIALRARRRLTLLAGRLLHGRR